jgi:hypothetical protein
MAQKKIQPKAASGERSSSKTAAAGVEKKSLSKRVRSVRSKRHVK